MSPMGDLVIYTMFAHSSPWVPVVKLCVINLSISDSFEHFFAIVLGAVCPGWPWCGWQVILREGCLLGLCGLWSSSSSSRRCSMSSLAVVQLAASSSTAVGPGLLALHPCGGSTSRRQRRLHYRPVCVQARVLCGASSKMVRPAPPWYGGPRLCISICIFIYIYIYVYIHFYIHGLIASLSPSISPYLWHF